VLREAHPGDAAPAGSSSIFSSDPPGPVGAGGISHSNSSGQRPAINSDPDNNPYPASINNKSITSSGNTILGQVVRPGNAGDASSAGTSGRYSQPNYAGRTRPAYSVGGPSGVRTNPFKTRMGTGRRGMGVAAGIEADSRGSTDDRAAKKSSKNNVKTFIFDLLKALERVETAAAKSISAPGRKLKTKAGQKREHEADQAGLHELIDPDGVFRIYWESADEEE
jgi:hypothetical protein